MAKAFEKIYQFKLTLKGIRPPIWRRIQVPENYTFWDLHVAIQDAMGWQDYHLHAFYILDPDTGQKVTIGIPDEEYRWDDHTTLAGWEHQMAHYFIPENDKALYVYDFGDDWQHDIKLEKILTRERELHYPVCLAGKRACPPEDCGGVWGYEDLLEVLRDPQHEEYEEMTQWVGEDFDPEYFQSTEVSFSDPLARWQYAFGDEDDLGDEEFDDVEEKNSDGLKFFSRTHMRQLWEKAKRNELEELSPGDKQLAEIMLDHEDQFFNEFEFADVTYDHEYDPDTEVNPFLHISLHSVVENQLSEKDPIEVFQFYNAMRKKKCSHHESVHLIGAILAPLMFSVMRDQKAFDIDTYKFLLKKYKTRNPGKIFDSLEKEKKLYPLE